MEWCVADQSLTHSQRELAKQMQCIFYMQTPHKQLGNIYLYIMVQGDKVEAFRHAMAGEAEVEIERFGRIIASGYGQPTVEEMMKIEELYGVKHANIIELPPPGTPVAPEA